MVSQQLSLSVGLTMKPHFTRAVDVTVFVQKNVDDDTCKKGLNIKVFAFVPCEWSLNFNEICCD